MKLDTPLSQVRVLNIGIGWAGRVASMLLAEQGADVIEIIRPGRRSHPADVVLDRSKRLVELNIKKSGHLEKVLDLAKNSNITIVMDVKISFVSKPDFPHSAAQTVISCLPLN